MAGSRARLEPLVGPRPAPSVRAGPQGRGPLRAPLILHSSAPIGGPENGRRAGGGPAHPCARCLRLPCQLSTRACQ
eukprot:10118196-Alexandrium_andersonii.AAC.1